MSKGLEKLDKGKFRRKIKRTLAIFIDGVGLDRATRRLARKVDLTKFVQGLSEGTTPEFAKYYTLVPHEDDARQIAFLEAVERSGLSVSLKRLPPKGVKRAVSMDVHIATDLLLFATGSKIDSESSGIITNINPRIHASPAPDTGPEASREASQEAIAEPDSNIISSSISPTSTWQTVRSAVLVCPNRELTYAIHHCKQLGIQTSLADFGLYGNSDGWKGIDRWIDLSTSETIWLD